MSTLVFHPLWDSAELYEEKYERLAGLIASERQAGRGVVLVGVSAGATLAMLALAKLPEPPIALVSVCGFVRLKESDKHGSPYANASWYRAGEAAEKSLARLSNERKSSILCFIPRVDRVVEPERQRIEGATNVTMSAGGHLWGIVEAMVWRHGMAEQFVRERV